MTPSAVAICSDLDAPPIRDRATTAALYARRAEIVKLPEAQQAAAYAQLEADAAAAGETELEAAAALSTSVVLRNRDQLTAADQALQRAYRRASDIRAEGLAAIALVGRASIAGRNGDLAGALSMLKLAVDVADRPEVSPRTRVRIYAGVGCADRDRGELQAAVEQLKAARDLIAKHDLKTGVLELEVRSCLVQSLRGIAGRGREAVELARENVEATIRVSGENSSNHATSLGSLAVSLRNTGDLDAAIAYDRKALEIMAATLPPEHSRVLEQRSHLADDLAAAGQFEEARREYEACLAQYDRNEALRATPPTLFKGLAEALRGVGRHDEGIRMFEQAIVESTSQRGKDHPATLTYMVMLAGYEIDRGQLDAAARHVAAVEQSCLAHPQLHDARLGTLRRAVAVELTLARGDPRTAESLARKALTELADHKSMGQREMLLLVAQSLVAQRRWADARRVLDQALATEAERAKRADIEAGVELLIAQADYGLGRRTQAIELARHARGVLAGFPNQLKARAVAAAFLAKVDRPRGRR